MKGKFFERQGKILLYRCATILCDIQTWDNHSNADLKGISSVIKILEIINVSLFDTQIFEAQEICYASA